ncbi:hypothetical protein [Paenibacillus pinihumi]|uniref:hypothetical protein n=1 Tax=Paenibacillus pinihumi TaxID=669462 RepID=UPI0003FADE15|nr:hypothetical protein [Paenibacillus pinihumi]
MEKETVYYIRYTADNRIKSIHASQEPPKSEMVNKYGGWLIMAVGAVLCVWWWFAWV